MTGREARKCYEEICQQAKLEYEDRLERAVDKYKAALSNAWEVYKQNSLQIKEEPDEKLV